MNISSIGVSFQSTAVTKYDDGKKTHQSDKASAATSNQDTYVSSENGVDELTKTQEESYVPSEEGAAYCDNKLTEEQVKELEDQIHQRMVNLVESMLGIQIRNTGSTTLDADTLLKRAEADENGDISQDPVWGVDAVATRLMDFAIALSGGDSSKAEMLREAVKKGFEAVGALDSLPQVCQDTYEETMKRFDYWQENGSMDGYVMGSESDSEE